jgi:hypothetical protein
LPALAFVAVAHLTRILEAFGRGEAEVQILSSRSTKSIREADFILAGLFHVMLRNRLGLHSILRCRGRRGVVDGQQQCELFAK